jgi:hypothetical protein
MTAMEEGVLTVRVAVATPGSVVHRVDFAALQTGA